MGRKGRKRVAAESGEVCVWHLGLWVCPQPLWGSSSSGDSQRLTGSPLAINSRADSRKHISQLSLSSSLSFPLPNPVTIISSQSDKFLQLNHVWPGRPPTHHFHFPHLLERLYWSIAVCADSLLTLLPLFFGYGCVSLVVNWQGKKKGKTHAAMKWTLPFLIC